MKKIVIFKHREIAIAVDGKDVDAFTSAAHKNNINWEICDVVKLEKALAWVKRWQDKEGDPAMGIEPKNRRNK